MHEATQIFVQQNAYPWAEAVSFSTMLHSPKQGMILYVKQVF